MKMKKKIRALNVKPLELTDEELGEVSGGGAPDIYKKTDSDWNEEDIRAEYINGQKNENVPGEMPLPTGGPPVEIPGTGLVLPHF